MNERRIKVRNERDKLKKLSQQIRDHYAEIGHIRKKRDEITSKYDAKIIELNGLIIEKQDKAQRLAEKLDSQTEKDIIEFEQKLLNNRNNGDNG